MASAWVRWCLLSLGVEKDPAPPQAEGGVLTAGMALALRREAWPVAAENSG